MRIEWFSLGSSGSSDMKLAIKNTTTIDQITNRSNTDSLQTLKSSVSSVSLVVLCVKQKQHFNRANHRLTHYDCEVMRVHVRGGLARATRNYIDIRKILSGNWRGLVLVSSLSSNHITIAKNINRSSSDSLQTHKSSLSSVSLVVLCVKQKQHYNWRGFVLVSSQSSKRPTIAKNINRSSSDSLQTLKSSVSSVSLVVLCVK
jgi:RNA polymerase subunit RPABC4/transcription elongation factor Spt4